LVVPKAVCIKAMKSLAAFLSSDSLKYALDAFERLGLPEKTQAFDGVGAGLKDAPSVGGADGGWLQAAARIATARAARSTIRRVMDVLLPWAGLRS
jgi:hypothetical protein